MPLNILKRNKLNEKTITLFYNFLVVRTESAGRPPIVLWKIQNDILLRRIQGRCSPLGSQEADLSLSGKTFCPSLLTKHYIVCLHYFLIMSQDHNSVKNIDLECQETITLSIKSI